MAELSTIARPYAKAAFDFAVEHKAVDSWTEMLTFASLVSENESIKPLLNGTLLKYAVSKSMSKVKT